ncbi:hypothetical protein X777_04065 [Ooceraea biroi]|uniref:Uncharacterized protein n=1 Tax=Ooceraea biroi TaxID=2015173 RepID=A0A026WIC5_OOCBI|nr:hypothetical protein X777_04065 [Ooceraea biroi]
MLGPGLPHGCSRIVLRIALHLPARRGLETPSRTRRRGHRRGEPLHEGAERGHHQIDLDSSPHRYVPAPRPNRCTAGLSRVSLIVAHHRGRRRRGRRCATPVRTNVTATRVNRASDSRVVAGSASTASGHVAVLAGPCHETRERKGRRIALPNHLAATTRARRWIPAREACFRFALGTPRNGSLGSRES